MVDFIIHRVESVLALNANAKFIPAHERDRRSAQSIVVDCRHLKRVILVTHVEVLPGTLEDFVAAAVASYPRHFGDSL